MSKVVNDMTPRGWRRASGAARARVVLALMERYPLSEIRVSLTSLLLLEEKLPHPADKALFDALDKLCREPISPQQEEGAP